MEATAASRLPPLLTRFQQRCPQVEITLHPADPPVNRGVVNAALDAALVCLPPGPMVNRPVLPSWHSPRCFMKP
jgi:DNA-binding transcriptional LysR family regulator